MHSERIDTEKELTLWLLTVEGMVQVTRMLVALRELALTDIDSACAKHAKGIGLG